MCTLGRRASQLIPRKGWGGDQEKNNLPFLIYIVKQNMLRMGFACCDGIRLPVDFFKGKKNINCAQKFSHAVFKKGFENPTVHLFA